VEHKTKLRVAHLVDGMDGQDHLWGKERVVLLLMREQARSGRIDPRLITFSAGSLATTLAEDGFDSESLSAIRSHLFASTFGPLRRSLARRPVDVIHSHGYRANIVAKLLRLTNGMRGVKLISTCHGWDAMTPNLRFYNTIDRLTSPISDMTVVPDATMLASLPGIGRRRYVPNAVDERAPLLDPEPRGGDGPFVVGTLGRVTAHKGILEFLEVAKSCEDSSILFTVAGAGDLTQRVRDAGPNVRYLGYFTQSDAYLAGLDVYVQASRSEGLSLSLLEAMRAGKPIVATDVGGTTEALTDGDNALVIPSGKPAALRDALLALRREPALAARLGANARSRFLSDFRIERQHQRYLDIYRSSRYVS
jgi:glycosyltransferase involved in cell wall biosynthesis